MMNCKGSGRN